MAPEQKKPWILVAAAIAVVLSVATTIALVDLPGEHLLARGGSSPREPAASPLLPQATWEINVHASGVNGNLTPAQKKVIDRQQPELRSLVKRVYDSLFIHPNRLPDTLKENFSQPAAIALRRARAGVTEPGRVATTFRRASIGIDATGGSRMAVASVTVRAVGDGVDRPVLHRSALWLERVRDEWKVVAFDVQQGPVPEPQGKQRKTPPKKKRSRGTSG